jgi:hypothetical protein
MKRGLLALAGLLAVALVLGPITRATGGDREKDDKGWKKLFNGKDLTGWKTHPDDPGMWSVKDGAIVGEGKMRSHLFSERGDYENFHYRVEAKISDKGNSGQYFRTMFGPGYPKGYEAQINSTFPDPQKTGSLYGIVKITEQLVPPDTWFTQEVIARGNHIIIKVNGKETANVKNDLYSKGHFAFQQHSPGPDGTPSTVYIRKVEVRELPATDEK